ncbi:MAG: 2-amino-4-hydroxy-6-hydroxymethyldihydropteridine diphosphokinase [Pararhodobacter sp.]
MQNAKNNSFLIALGANLGVTPGKNAQALDTALQLLGEGDAALGAVSGYYRTPAFPPGAGGAFVNACALLHSPLNPNDFLARLHAVEASMGRVRAIRWGARVVDVDLLAMAGAVLPDPAVVRHWMALAPAQQQTQTPDQLILPHPRLHQRAFVLVPLADIAPDWCHPLTGQSVRSMLAALPDADRLAVRRL